MSFLKIVNNVKDDLKDKHKRPRPFISHSDIKPCLPLESSFFIQAVIPLGTHLQHYYLLI